MTAAAAVLALVLLMTAVGSSALLWLAPTFGAVRHGYELLTGATVVLLAWGGLAAFRGPFATLRDPDAIAASAQVSTAVTVLIVATVVAVAALFVRLPLVIGRVIGIVATLAGIASFVPLALIRDVGSPDRGFVGGVAELLVGSLFLGAIWVGMILGHWYLVERRLTNRPMIVIAWINVVGVVAGLASLLLSARNPVPCVGLDGAAFQQCAMTFAPVLRIGSMTLTLGFGVLVLVAIIAAFNVRLAREGGRSIQASTGMFYLAVILAPAVEFAAKVRFF